MKKLVICVVFLALLCSLVPVTHAESSISNGTITCESIYCYVGTWWGNNPNDPSYGDAAYIPGTSCSVGGCFTQSNGTGHFDMAGCAKFAPSEPIECLTGIEVGNLAQTAGADSGHSYCAGQGAGIFWYVVVRNTNGAITADYCEKQDSNNAGNVYQVKISRYFSGSGGYNVWLLGTSYGAPVCNPCSFPFTLYAEPNTLYYTDLELFYYDTTTVINPVNTVNWQYNQFQKTDGTWHYQTNSGNYSESGNVAQEWWVVPPQNSSTGGDLDACVDQSVNHADCVNI